MDAEDDVAGDATDHPVAALHDCCNLLSKRSAKAEMEAAGREVRRSVRAMTAAVEQAQSLHIQENDGDVAHLMQLCQADESLVNDAKRNITEIMKIVSELGGNVGRYRREREKAQRHLVAEVYSRPRVTAAAKLLPGLGIIPGFALDLSTTDERGYA